MADAVLQLLAKDGHVLAEGKSNADGISLLAADRDQRSSASLIIGTTAAGDVDMFDLSQLSNFNFAAPAPSAMLSTDRDFYQTGSTALITLWARDAHGQALAIANSSLKLVRPDQTFHSEQAVVGDKTGPQFFTIPVPDTTSAGQWRLLWQQADGKILAQTSFGIGPDASQPKFDVTADRTILDNDGNLNLTIKVTNRQNQPVAWHKGQVSWQTSQLLFNNWKNYRFGLTTPDSDPTTTASFLTDASGMAHVHLQLPMKDKINPTASSGTRAVKITTRMTSATGLNTLTLPVRPNAAWVGVRPLPDDRPFAENSLAQFNVIALDNGGKRRGLNDLYFQIYEEGRSFKWYPEEGRWQYHPLPQHRRLNGGHLNISASGDTLVRMPVTAGHYVLEITSSDGIVLAQYDFDAGWNQPPAAAQNDNRLVLTAKTLEPDHENSVKFTLAQAALVTFVIGDDRVRQTVQKFFPAGDNQLNLTPQHEWGAQIQVQAQALFATGERAMANATLPLHHPAQDLVLTLSAPALLTSGQTITLPVLVQKLAGQQNNFVSATLTPITTNIGAPVPVSNNVTAPVGTDGRAMLVFKLPGNYGRIAVVHDCLECKPAGTPDRHYSDPASTGGNSYDASQSGRG